MVFMYLQISSMAGRPETPVDELCQMIVNGSDLQNIKSKVKSDVDVNSKSWKENTPLHCAIQNKRSDVIDFLIQTAGAKPTLDNLYAAIQKDLDLKLIKLMVDSGDLYVNEKNECGNTPSLCFAAQQNRLNIISYLIQDAAAKPTINDLCEIIHNGSGTDLQIIKSILDSGLDADEKGREGKTPLHHAVQRGRHELVDYMIQHSGASVDGRSLYDTTPLIEAVKSGSNELCEMLVVRHYADISLVDSAGRNAVMWASNFGRPQVLLMLINHGGLSLIDEVDYRGRTALMYASDRPECVQILLSCGADMQVKYLYIGALLDH